MRVAANLAWIRPGRVGGSEEYTTRLIAAVARSSPDDLVLSVLATEEVRAAHPELSDVEFRSLGSGLQGRAHRLVVESTRVYAAAADADVVHHFGGRVPARRHGNDVVTIHDLQPLDLPHNFSPAKVAYLRRALPRSIRAARRVCVPSSWVAASLVDRFPIAEGRVRVVSSTWAAEPSGAVDDALLARLAARPMVLFPAITHPHKNHAVLLAAVDHLAATHPDVVLVLAGGVGRAEDEVAGAVARARVEVLRPGRVSEATLHALTARADVVAFPSRYEGFGLPVIEAMRAGTAVVAARATALPDVVGPAALLVSPDDVVGWADALRLVLDDPATRERLVAAGHLRANDHQPAVAGARLLDVWRELA